MRRGSTNLTPIYIFSEIRAGSGKSSIVSNLCVYLNETHNKVALIDLDSEHPLKLKSAFPENYELEEYAELDTLVHSNDPRFQQNFYITDTSKVSYFPAHQIKGLGQIMSDAALRDFLMQVAGSFDFVFVNLASGAQQAKGVSDLFTKPYLFRGCKPASVIVTPSDEKSLIELDQFINANQIVSYQAEENTFFVFNKVPRSIEEQNLNDSLLNAAEVRKLFPYPLTYVIPFIDEFMEQRNSLNTFVLQKDSQINLHIVGLHRLLMGATSLSYLMREVNNYQSCISGNLLSKIYPYMEELQKRIASKLFIDVSDVQLFLEQNDNSFRIRVRLTSIGQKLLGINSHIPEYSKLSPINVKQPESFETKSPRDSFRTIENIDRDSSYILSFKSIFTFDDSFASTPVTELNKEIAFIPKKDSFPSPIYLAQATNLTEIPTLNNILGIVRQAKPLPFFEKPDEVIEGGVSAIYIPTDFDLWDNLSPKFEEDYVANEKAFEDLYYPLHKPNLADNSEYFSPKYEEYSIFDIFSRDKDFEFASDFNLRGNPFYFTTVATELLPAGQFSLLNDDSLSHGLKLIEPEIPISSISSISVAKFTLTAVASNMAPQQANDEPEILVNFISPQSYSQSNIELPKSAFKFEVPKSLKIQVDKRIYGIDEATTHRQIDPEVEKSFNSKKIHSHLPANYDYTTNLVRTMAEFHDKLDRTLPSTIGLADTLMDYSYSDWILSDEDHYAEEQRLISQKPDYYPELTLRFEHKYMEPNLQLIGRATYEKPIMYQVFVQKKLRVLARVTITNAEYKVSYVEIFPVIFLPKMFNVFLTRNFKKIQRIGEEGQRYPDALTDMPLSVPGLRIIRKESKYLELPTEKLNQSYSIEQAPILTFPVTYRVMAAPKLQLDEAKSQLSNLPLTSATATAKMPIDNEIRINAESYNRVVNGYAPLINQPDLFIERMRFRGIKLTTFNWKDFVAETIKVNVPKIDFLPAIRSYNIRHHSFVIKPEIPNPDRESKYPFRIIAQKLINNFTDLNDLKPSYEIKKVDSFSEIDVLPPEQLELNESKVAYPLQTSVSHIALPKNYILKQTAIKIPNPEATKSQINIKAESPAEVLYKELQRSYNIEFGQMHCEYNENVKADQRNMLDEFGIYQTKANPSEVEYHYNLHFRNKYAIPLPRKAYKVVNNNLKDLLAVARAQTAFMRNSSLNK